jgi:predicted ribosome quality control (RQC) complex YloA/Tae2 family protein
MKKTPLILFLSLLTGWLFGQEFIYPGTSKTISAGNDTLYVITISQMQQALINAKEKTALETINRQLYLKIDEMERKEAALDSLIAVHHEKAVYYQKLWEAAEQDLMKATDIAKKQKHKKILAGLGGLASGLLIGIFIL